jgi:hypothetical protein
MLAFDQELKVWDASSEADFDGWQLRYVEKLAVDRDERAVLVTVRRGEERRQVYVDRELGQTLHRRFVKALGEEWIEKVNRHSKRESNER